MGGPHAGGETELSCQGCRRGGRVERGSRIGGVSVAQISKA